MYITSKIVWINPEDCIPPHSISHPDKLCDFANLMYNEGWKDFPILIGYPLGNKIQLLSGTHRHRAAFMAGLNKIPVKVWPNEIIEDSFGNLDKWKMIMSDEIYDV